MNAVPEQAALTTALTQQWDALDALVTGIDEKQWRTPSPLPGWTVFDVLAHVVGTESLLLGEQSPTANSTDETVDDVRNLPHVHNETAVLNEIWIRGLRPLSGTELHERFRDVIARRRTALAAMDETQWHTPTRSPIGEVPYGRFMRVRLFDCWMHELDIADALETRIGEGGPRGDLAFAEIAASVPRVLAKRGKAPEGSRITVELTGTLARTLHIEVADRARYVDSFDDPATVTIRLDGGLFARLSGGRIAADTVADRIEFSGDVELGHQLVGNLAFTI